MIPTLSPFSPSPPSSVFFAFSSLLIQDILDHSRFMIMFINHHGVSYEENLSTEQKKEKENPWF